MINPLTTVRAGTRQLLGVRATADVPVLQQLRQMAQLRSASGVSRAEYFKYCAWRPELTLVERLTYTSHRERRATETATNQREPIRRHRPKSEQQERFAQAGLPLPTLLGRVGVVPGIRDIGVAILDSAGMLAEWLATNARGGLVFKPELGMQGNGIMVAADGASDGVVLLSGVELSTSALWRRLSAGTGGWRIERWIRPHPALAGFRPGATPTVRVLTLLVDGGAVVHAATLKLPVGDSGVDNLAQGNLVATIDLEAGVVGAATDGLGNLRLDHHPGSGASIRGLQLPWWSEVQAVARRGALLLAPRRAIGWDVAVTESGPVVIEANSSWCEKLIQLPAGRGLTRGAFIRLLHEVDAGAILARRRRMSPEWLEFERAALAGVA
ncbi:MAG: sugar-transfer associated ATP-grasp domain-containing protein [Gemmatimonadales bacterium]